MSNFDDCNPISPRRPANGQENRCDDSPLEALDNLKRDRFELLSAYLDGEVTADERRQVETWLDNDPKVQRLYTRLLKLRQSLRTMPVPASDQSAEQIAERVVARLQRRPKRTFVWGGMAIAALFVSAIVGTLPRHDFAPSVANAPQTEKAASKAVPNEGLMIALDRPVIQMPTKSAVSGSQPSIYHQGNSIQ